MQNVYIANYFFLALIFYMIHCYAIFFFYFRDGVVEASDLLVYDAGLLGNRFPIFRSNVMVSS
jgi:hypothetical protein